MVDKCLGTDTCQKPMYSHAQRRAHASGWHRLLQGGASPALPVLGNASACCAASKGHKYRTHLDVHPDLLDAQQHERHQRSDGHLRVGARTGCVTLRSETQH